MGDLAADRAADRSFDRCADRSADRCAEWFERAPSTLWRMALDGVVLFPGGSSAPWFLSSPGDALWELLAEPATADELIADLADVYGADPATVRRDIEPVLAILLESGAVRAAHQPDSTA